MNISLSRILVPAAMVAIGLSMSNCSEQRVEQNDYDSPNEFMMNNRPEEQTFVLDTGGQGPIIGNQGTRLWMDSSIFMFPGGGDVSYPIIIKLVELYTPKDMMLYAMPTVAQGNLLVTGGELRVRAFKDDVELVLKPNRFYRALAPTTVSDPNMGLFLGQESGDIVDWTETTDFVTDSLGLDSATNFYDIFVPQMGWINCDYFYGSDPDSLTTITFTSEDDVLDNVMKFLYFDNIQSVMQVYGNTSGMVPIGASVKSLCFALGSSGGMYYHMEEFNVVANDTVQVTMQEISEADLLLLMGGL